MRYRTGRKVGRTIYRQEGPEPSDDDVLLGLMDTPEEALRFVTAINAAHDPATQEHKGYEALSYDVFLDDLRDLMDVVGLSSAAGPRAPHDAFQECVDRVRKLVDALEFIQGIGDQEHLLEAYRSAGGGYAGLQAVASYALPRRPPTPLKSWNDREQRWDTPETPEAALGAGPWREPRR